MFLSIGGRQPCTMFTPTVSMQTLVTRLKAGMATPDYQNMQTMWMLGAWTPWIDKDVTSKELMEYYNPKEDAPPAEDLIPGESS